MIERKLKYVLWTNLQFNIYFSGNIKCIVANIHNIQWNANFPDVQLSGLLTSALGNFKKVTRY